MDAIHRPGVRSPFRALGLLLVAVMGVPLTTAAVAASATTPPATTFNYTGTIAHYTVPGGVHHVVVETWGAGAGGPGGHARGTLAVTPGELLRVRVGGSNGFNGGGAGGAFGGNGGGATDVRRGGDSLADRVVIAGGGGGGGINSCCSGFFSEPFGGDGGGVRGGDGGGESCGDCGGRGATQTEGGAGACGSGNLGSGADACSGDGGGGGGGGGLYGGGSASGFRDTSPSCLPFCGGYGWGGGGGSGFVTPSAYAAANEAGVNVGDGHASIRPASPPSAPQHVFAFPLNGRVPVGWTPPANNDLPIAGYTVRVYQGGVLQQAVVAPTARSYIVTGLTNGEAYAFTVAASNATGTGAASARLAVRVGTPVFLQLPVASPGNGSMTVTWHPPITNGSDVTQYRLTPYRSGVAQTPLVFGPARTSTLITGLTNGDVYTFVIVAKNANGTGPPSDPSVAVNVGAPGPPGAPSASPGNASATVSWTAPATNNGSAVVGYVVTRYGGGARVSRVYNSTATTQVVTGLTNGTTYTFTVAAKNARGIGAQSVASNAVTPS